ncbi:hypothetical protein K490DRAFT_51050 [Saccharata proteae CBS 121410]|uniref:FAD/NAD(P)-binding domain-containing protein n=1 Tax=Saccharata proteae CBS 121410 TaxID=1314787 RepID=A0A9P4HMS4_9PEZI|nr:hypothetical protein K490DRAFT_51050 [Saccharata proteae CBS 121410]
MSQSYNATASSSPTYGAVVVGGGPAGITVVGNLLEQRVKRILWVDPKFEAGRVNARYREVPSNTKVKLFIDFAEAVQPFRSILESTPSPNAITELRQLRQDKGCNLGKAADMCLMLTDGLSKNPSIQQTHGSVRGATFDPSTSQWTIDLSPSAHDSPMASDAAPITSPTLVLCTGSSPISAPLNIASQQQQSHLQSIDLDLALAPSRLSTTLPSSTPTTVAVIGASHSAILVLLNLSHLAQSSHPHLRIKWFTRSPLRYAEQKDGWILRDNTGLKGEAADWARQNLEDATFPTSPVSSFLTKIFTPPSEETHIYACEMPDCHFLVQAIGYKRDAIPDLRVAEGAKSRPLNASYDPLTGAFVEEAAAEKKSVPGLFGAGIAYPERVTDPEGNVEYAVGFWKFMRFVKKVAPEWVKGGRGVEV